MVLEYIGRSVGCDIPLCWVFFFFFNHRLFIGFTVFPEKLPSLCLLSSYIICESKWNLTFIATDYFEWTVFLMSFLSCQLHWLHLSFIPSLVLFFYAANIAWTMTLSSSLGWVHRKWGCSKVWWLPGRSSKLEGGRDENE